ncbi:ferritin-like domain-containing protein [Aquisalimonas sp.]|uniref:ferritin-like domain-containing protein n=1 Tax=Aquisalimonas sp. TaxID=1872621 RepID=UPI0025B8C355|nr:ferritin-like domain-containing protein [Aquisalimonas sp.]
MANEEKFDSLDDLFIHQLEDLYDAEQRMTRALPKMRDAASHDELRDAFSYHLEETQSQIQRLETIFEALGKSPQRETCEAMKGLIREGEEMINAKGNDTVRDAALIAAAQRVEHYEIAAYGTAHTIALQLGNREAAQQLDDTLHEEKNVDAKLTEIAQSYVNPAT